MATHKRKYCARRDCIKPVSPPSTRYCDQHKREHAAQLQADLDAIERQLHG